MRKLRLSKQADRYLSSIPAKHERQIAEKIQVLLTSPDDLPTMELRGYAPWRRAKSGEYRIIYKFDGDTVRIGLIGKRNDGDIYRLAKRFLG